MKSEQVRGRVFKITPLQDRKSENRVSMKERLRSIVRIDLQRADGAHTHKHLAAFEQIKEIIVRRRPQCVTFDVFDTVIWRPARAPHHMFLGLGRSLQAQGMLSAFIDPPAFAEARRAAETLARQRKSARGEIWEVTLDEIYRELDACLSVSRSKAIAAEVEFERQNTYPDPIVARLIEWIASKGIKIAFVSDTYFSASDIYKLIEEKLPIKISAEDIFVSCERHVDKERGLLAHVVRQYGLPPTSILHVGDNHDADHIGAKLIGSLPIHLKQFKDLDTERFRLEEHLAVALGHDWSCADLHVGVDSVRRHVSLAAQGFVHASSLASDLAFTTVGPVLTGFVEWVVRRAADLGIKKLFCLTREGLFLSELINTYAEHTGAQVFAAPFLSSRAVIYPTLFNNCDAEEFRIFFFSRRTPMTLRSFFNRIGNISLLSEFPASLRDFPLRIGSDVTDTIIRTLASSDKFRMPILEWAARQRASLKIYVDANAAALNLQSGEEIIGLVDLGWTTRSQRVLENALREVGFKNPTIGLYLATDSIATEEIARGTLSQGFLFNCGLPRNDAAIILRCKEILEQVCSADVGSVKGYGPQGQIVFSKNNTHTKQKQFLRDLRNGVRQFLKSYLTLRDNPGYRLSPTALSDMQSALRIVLGRLTVMPTDGEVEEIGSWNHEENNGSDYAEQVCDPFFDELIGYATANQINALPVYWVFGHLVRRRPAMFEKLLLKSAGFHKEEHDRFCAARMYLTAPNGSTADLPADYFVTSDGRAISYCSFFTMEPTRVEWGNFGSDPSVFVERVLISLRDCHAGTVKRFVHENPAAVIKHGPIDAHGRVIVHQSTRAGVELPLLGGPHEVSIILCLSVP